MFKVGKEKGQQKAALSKKSQEINEAGMCMVRQD